MVDSFRTFDKENDGLISEEDLRRIYRDLGDEKDKRLSDEEIDDFLQEYQHLAVNGQYQYVKLARGILDLDADHVAEASVVWLMAWFMVLRVMLHRTHGMLHGMMHGMVHDMRHGVLHHMLHRMLRFMLH